MADVHSEDRVRAEAKASQRQRREWAEQGLGRRVSRTFHHYNRRAKMERKSRMGPNDAEKKRRTRQVLPRKTGRRGKRTAGGSAATSSSKRKGTSETRSRKYERLPSEATEKTIEISADGQEEDEDTKTTRPPDRAKWKLAHLRFCFFFIQCV